MTIMNTVQSNYVNNDQNVMESDSENEKEQSIQGNTNQGWADSISKILKSQKPKKKKVLVLSRAKKLADQEKKAPPKKKDFEIVGQAENAEQTDSSEADDADREERPRKKRKELPSLRIKPNILEKDRERTLSKIATRGVVQLFNTVRTQQKDITTKLNQAGPLDSKRERVLKNIDKRSFLKILTGNAKSVNVNKVEEKNPEKIDLSEKPANSAAWNVLRDDFMMKTKLKDWDKDDSEDEQMSVENEGDAESSENSTNESD